MIVYQRKYLIEGCLYNYAFSSPFRFAGLILMQFLKKIITKTLKYKSREIQILDSSYLKETVYL